MTRFQFAQALLPHELIVDNFAGGGGASCDYSAPTIRKRLFLVARRDGQRIIWPEPTHANPKKIGTDLFTSHLKPWRTAAECIDWSIPCPSIFERDRPLADIRRAGRGTTRRQSCPHSG